LEVLGTSQGVGVPRPQLRIVEFLFIVAHVAPAQALYVAALYMCTLVLKV